MLSSDSGVLHGFSPQEKQVYSDISTILKPHKPSWLTPFISKPPAQLPINEIIPLLESATGKVIDAVLWIKLEIHGSLLNVLTGNMQQSKDFVTMINKASPNVIDEALQIFDNRGASALHIAANGDSSKLIVLIQRASRFAIDAALSKINNKGCTPLHLIAMYQKNSNVWKVLIEKVSPEGLDASVKKTVDVTRLGNQQNANVCPDEWTALHFAARYQSAAGFKALINAVYPKTLNDIAKIIVNYGETLLYLAVEYQTRSDAFITLIEKLDPDTLSRVKTKKGYLRRYNNLKNLCDASKTQPIENFIRFLVALTRIDDYYTKENLREYLSGLLNSDLSAVFLSYFCISPNPELMKVLISYEHEDEIYSILFDRYKRSLLGTRHLPPLDPEILFFLAEYITEKETITHDELGFLDNYKQQYLSTLGFIPGNQEQGPLGQRVGNLEKYGMLLHEINQILYWFMPHEGEARAMPRVNLVMAPNEKIYQPVPDALRVLFESGKVLMKVVKECNWDELLKQLADYNYRPKDIRHQHPGTHKYVHNTGEIVTYLEKRNRDKVRDKIKKNSVTSISSELCTPLYGSDSSKTLVGIILDIDKCKIKAQLLANGGTYKRGWVGSEQAVSAYKKIMEKIVVPEDQREQFKAKIKDKASKINEVLAKYGREAIVGVVMATDTLDAYELAQRYQRDLSQLGVNVPIVNYDPIMRQAYVAKPALQPIR